MSFKLSLIVVNNDLLIRCNILAVTADHIQKQLPAATVSACGSVLRTSLFSIDQLIKQESHRQTDKQSDSQLCQVDVAQLFA